MSQYSWMPIDVGFDVRTVDMDVLVPEDVTSIKYDVDGREHTVSVSGAPEAVRILRGAGYRADETTSHDPSRYLPAARKFATKKRKGKEI